MENKQILNEKELEKVAGGVDTGWFEVKFQCNKCGHVENDTCSSSGLAAIREKYENSQCSECDGSYVYVDSTFHAAPNPGPIRR